MSLDSYLGPFLGDSSTISFPCIGEKRDLYDKGMVFEDWLELYLKDHTESLLAHNKGDSLNPLYDDVLTRLIREENADRVDAIGEDRNVVFFSSGLYDRAKAHKQYSLKPGEVERRRIIEITEEK